MSTHSLCFHGEIRNMSVLMSILITTAITVKLVGINNIWYSFSLAYSVLLNF